MSYGDLAAKLNIQGVGASKAKTVKIDPIVLPSQGKIDRAMRLELEGSQTGLTRGEKTLLLGALGIGASTAAIGSAMTGQSSSKKEAIAGGAAKGGLSYAMTGAALGSAVGPAGTATGAIIGGITGLVAGGIAGGMKASKDYITGKKAERARKRQMRFDTYESGARQRAAAGRGVEMVERTYAATTSPAELDTTVSSGVSSFDNYKARTYGG